MKKLYHIFLAVNKGTQKINVDFPSKKSTTNKPRERCNEKDVSIEELAHNLNAR